MLQEQSCVVEREDGRWAKKGTYRVEVDDDKKLTYEQNSGLYCYRTYTVYIYGTKSQSMCVCVCIAKKPNQRTI